MSATTTPTSAFTTTTFSGLAPADTAGWDIVYAVKASIVNASLTEFFSKGGLLASQLSFDETIQTIPGLPAVTMKGSFGPWQLTTGGSGPLINIHIPVQSGNLLTGVPGSEPVDLSGGAVTIQVRLGFHAVEGVPSPTSPSATSIPTSTKAALKIVTGGSAPSSGSAADIRSGSTSSTAATTGSSTFAPDSGGSSTTQAPTSDNGNSISVLEVNIPGTANTFVKSSVSSMVEQWIARNPGIFDYVFLTMDVAETAAQGGWAWITPTFVGYAYADFLGPDGKPTGIDDALIAITSMTEGRTPGKNTDGTTIAVSTSVSEVAIPTNPGVNAALLIQPNLLLDKIIVPNMKDLFSDASADDFVVSDTNLSVSNVNALTLELEMDPTWYPFSKTCTATIPSGDLSVSFNQTNIQQTFSNISFPYGYQKELTVELSLTSTSALGVDGSGQFAMQYGTDTVSTLSVQPDQSKIAAESLESIGVGLVVTALCCLSFGAAGGEVAETSVAEEPTAENLTNQQQEVASEIQAGAEGESGANASVELQGPNNTINSSQVNSDLANTARSEMRNPGTWTLRGIQPRFTFKIWSMFVGMLAQQIYVNWSNLDIIEAYDQDPTKMPTLRNFLDGCISKATWTNTGDQTLICAGLNGAFVMGFSIAAPTNGTGA